MHKQVKTLPLNSLSSIGGYMKRHFFLTITIKITLSFLLFSTTAEAKLAGKNLLLVHGFQLEHLLSAPTDNGKADAENYWRNFEPATKNPESTRILHWPSHLRIEGQHGIAALLSEQLTTILSSGFCDNQCIIVTHSTGDLVTRYMLANKYSLLGPELAEKLKVAAVIDMAGAGGGTEIASVILDVINGINQSSTMVEIVKFISGVDLSAATTTGIVTDLQPNIARNLALNHMDAIPHLRIASTGNEDYFGFLSDMFIKGGDDSVVPLHSTCGAVFANSYSSCVKDLAMDGKVQHVNDAPHSSELYDYHYPIILSDALAHTDMNKDIRGNSMTFALEGASRYEDQNANALALLPEYEVVTFWWDWFNEYRLITGAQNKSVGRVIIDTFE
ncbi:hypothetical protein TDB9533_03488 [Thalassocella blandensis]|nr:hypothetical protein TDB9533_03488 [Thalassocella blandensis]